MVFILTCSLLQLLIYVSFVSMQLRNLVCFIITSLYMHLDTEKSLRDAHYTEHRKQEQEYQVLRTGVPGTTAKA